MPEPVSIAKAWGNVERALSSAMNTERQSRVDRFSQKRLPSNQPNGNEQKELERSVSTSE